MPLYATIPSNFGKEGKFGKASSFQGCFANTSHKGRAGNPHHLSKCLSSCQPLRKYQELHLPADLGGSSWRLVSLTNYPRCLLPKTITSAAF
jgi:hypothetical protein